MLQNEKVDLFKYVVSYSGLKIELISDCRQLLNLDFIKDLDNESSGYEKIPDPIKKVTEFLDDYFDGIQSKIKIVFNTEFSNLINNSSSLFLDMRSYTKKEILIYRELLNIEPGRTISYGELASSCGIALGARFAGNCMAANRFPIIIPCHRVIKKDGSTGNYTGGVKIKEYLLKHENIQKS